MKPEMEPVGNGRKWKISGMESTSKKRVDSTLGVQEKSLKLSVRAFFLHSCAN
jgi:hypothetical protein